MPNAKHMPRPRRGFLLMVIISVLAVLLAVCVGFLSFCRSEVNAVATIRDKNDCVDVMFSALDWTLGNIGNYSFSGGASFDAGKEVAYTHNAGGGQWWYRPNEKGLKAAIAGWTSIPGQTLNVYKWDNPTDYPSAPYSNPVPGSVDPNGRDEAAWVYLPENYFPEGGILGRFMVQVLDSNSVLCLNDWLDDCCPTQTQMAQMIRDSYGPQQLERYRAFRDSGNNGDWDRTIKLAPIRYQHAWYVASRSVRQPQYAFSYENASGFWGEYPVREVSPNWVTTNTTYFSPFGAEMILRASIPADGIFTHRSNIAYVNAATKEYLPPSPREGRPTSPYLRWVNPVPFQMPDADTIGKQEYAWNHPTDKPIKWTAGQLPTGMAYSIFGYEDPDTGRCPLNINTCYNSGERLPMNLFGGTPSHAIEGVFNIDSLRAIIQVDKLFVQSLGDPGPDGIFGNADDVPPVAPGLVEIVANDVYNTNDATCLPINDGVILLNKVGGGTACVDQYAALLKIERMKTKLAYQYQETLCRYFTGTYYTRRSTLNQVGNAFRSEWPPINPDPTNNAGFTVGAASSNYSAVRFPGGLAAFRAKVLADLSSMSTGNTTVSFDVSDNVLLVPVGNMDGRTVNAVYDNIVPGKALVNGNWGDPITELYQIRLGREEYSDDPYEANASSIYGYHFDRDGLIDSGAHRPGFPADGGTSIRPKGKMVADSSAPFGPWDRLGAPDLHLPTNTAYPTTVPANVDTINAGEVVPYRHLMFGPDWFSTELTTTTTSYVLIINAQIVDKKSVAENPDKPVVIGHFQFGAAVELCPDVQPDAGNYYGDGKPEYYKMSTSVIDGMNAKCGTTVTQYGNGTAAAALEDVPFIVEK